MKLFIMATHAQIASKNNMPKIPSFHCTESEAIEWLKVSKKHRLVLNPRRVAKLRKRGEDIRQNLELRGWLWVMK